MSYHLFFDFSQGLAKPLPVPVGEHDRIIDHVCAFEEKLGIERTTFNGIESWDTRAESYRQFFPEVDDKELCSTIEGHNQWVRWLWNRMTVWSENPPEPCEYITPEQAQFFWPCLRILDIPPSRWSDDYTINRMEHIYEVLRGRESEGVTLDRPKLTAKQAGGVIWLLEPYLSKFDLRFEVARGEDHLRTSDDYTWCSRCGAVTDEDANACRRRKCYASSRDCPKCGGDGIFEKRDKHGEWVENLTCPRCKGQGMVYGEGY